MEISEDSSMLTKSGVTSRNSSKSKNSKSDYDPKMKTPLLSRMIPKDTPLTQTEGYSHRMHKPLSCLQKLHDIYVWLLFGTFTCLIRCFKARGYDKSMREEADEKKQKAEDLHRKGAADPPYSDRICFIGASFFTRWAPNLEASFAPLPVFNHGFGGAQSRHVLEKMDALVFDFKPRLIVYSCGGNDVRFAEATGQSVQTAVDNFATFVEEAKKKLGGPNNFKILYICTCLSPIQFARGGDFVARVARINLAQKKSVAEKFSDCVEVLDLNQTPELDLVNDRYMYGRDLVHFNARGCAEIAEVMRPKVAELWEQMAKTSVEISID